MSGAGAYPAGIGPAGYSPVPDASGRPVAVPIAAFYDPALRGFPFDDNGEIVGVHPVDQEAALRVTIPLGSLRSSPLVGINWARIRLASGAALQRTIDDEVRTALRTLVNAGDVKINGSPLLPEAFGRPLFLVDYVNLRLSLRRTIVTGR